MSQPTEAKQVSELLRQRLQSLLSADPPRSKSLIVTVFGDCITPHGGAVMLTGLIKLLAPLSINHRLVRTSVHRLRNDDWLISKRQGRLSAYSLTPKGLRRFMNAYKRVYAPPAKYWDGAWTLVCFPKPANSQSAHKERIRELKWEGFGAMAPGVLVHPRASPTTLQDIFESTQSEEQVFVFSGRSLEQLSTQPPQDFVRRCWDFDSLANGYRSFIKRFEPIEATIDDFKQVDPRDAFTLRTLLIHHLRRVTLHDPLLPTELLPSNWPGHRAYEVCRTLYKRSYRKAELFLHEILDTPGIRIPDEAPYFHERFGGLD